jgi:hypothetical protein
MGVKIRNSDLHVFLLNILKALKQILFQYKLKGFPLGSTMFSKAFTTVKSESQDKY